MKHSHIGRQIVRYAKHPASPASCGVLSVINGVFAPFAKVPMAGFRATFMFEAMEGISLFNRGSGIAILVLLVVGWVLLVRKVYKTALVLCVISLTIVLAEAWLIGTGGITGEVRRPLIEGMPLNLAREHLVYDLTVRARFGEGIGYLLGGHIAFGFAAIVGLSPKRKEAG